MRILKQTGNEVHVEFDNVRDMVAVRNMPREQTKFTVSEQQDAKRCVQLRALSSALA